MAFTSSKSSFLFVLFLCLFGSVSSLAVRETNAQRMARGLSPLSPAHLHRASGTDSARRSVVSPAPPTTAAGRLQVRNHDGGAILGFVRNLDEGAPISGINVEDRDYDLHVSITYSPSSPQQLDILATDPKFPDPHYVGAIGSMGKFKTTSNDTLTFFNVGQTQPGSIPTVVGTSTSHVESAIWTIDPSSKKLKATWVNGDGSVFEPVLAYTPDNGNLFFVGNVQEWKSENPNINISQVDLFLV